MKKISLVLCFALLMVAMLALGVFAATYENIADDARIDLHDSNGTYGDKDALIDGDYSTACSAGDGPASWINYKFYYDADKFPKGVTVSSVRVIIDSTGEISNVGVVDTLTYSQYTIHLRLYDANGSASYFNQKWNSVSGSVIKEHIVNGTVMYRYLEVVFDTPVSNVYQVEVPVENGKNKNIGIWEVEIYNYVCNEAADHAWDNATCEEATTKTCKYCGITSNGHVYADATCVAPKTCVLCKEATMGDIDADAHTWLEANCSYPKRCALCTSTEGEAVGEHDWVDATCVRAKHCTICNVDEGVALPHQPLSVEDGNCTTAIYCGVCRNAIVPSLQHRFAEGSTKCINEGCTFAGTNIAATEAVEKTDDFGRPYTQPGPLVDGNYFTGCGGAHTARGVNYTFTFDKARNVGTIFIVTNSSGVYPGDTGAFSWDEMKDDNYPITISVYDGNNRFINISVNKYDLTKCVLYTDANGKTYVGYTLDVGYRNVTKVNVWVQSDYGNHRGIWEVEIWEHTECFYDTFVEHTSYPDCDDVGYDTYKCACGKTTSVEVAALGHAWNEGVETKAPTEEEEGIKLHTCTVCSATKEEKIPTLAHVHKYTEFTGTVITAPGCATEGVGIYACECGTATAEGPVAPTGEHNYTEYVSTVTDSTAFVEGVAINKCANCEATSEVAIPRKSYNFAIYASGATSATGAWTELPSALIDGNYNIGSAATHGYGSETYTITFSENYRFDKLVFIVNSVGRCPTDGAFYYPEKSSNSYTFQFYIYDENGKSVAYDSLNTANAVEMTGVDANGNEFKYDALVVELDESVVGKSIGVVVACKWDSGKLLWEVETWGVSVDLHTEHNFVETVIKNPTCIANGTGILRCDSCDATEGEEYEIAATGNHFYSVLIGLDEATCTTKGIKYLQCADCHESVQEKVIADALGHEMVDATCTTDAYCTRCDYTEEAFGHFIQSWLEGYVCVDSTCATAGSETGVCMNCEETVTLPMELNPYSHEAMAWNETKTIGYCSACEILKFEIIGAVCEANGYKASVYTREDGTFCLSVEYTVEIIIDEETGEKETKYVIYDEYTFVINEEVDGVYYITITECTGAYGEETLNLVDATATISIVERTVTLVITASEEVAYTFKLTIKPDFSALDGDYVTADESVKFEVLEGTIYIYVNGEYTSMLEVAFDENFDIVAINDEGAIVATWDAETWSWTYGEYTLTKEGADEEESLPEELPELELGLNYIEIMVGEGYGPYYYAVTEPGSYILSFDFASTEVWIVYGPTSSEWIQVASYAFVVEEGQRVVFAFNCLDEDGWYIAGEAIVALEVVPEEPTCEHNYVRTELVNPTLEEEGYIAYKCDKCDEVKTETIEKGTYYVTSAAELTAALCTSKEGAGNPTVGGIAIVAGNTIRLANDIDIRSSTYYYIVGITLDLNGYKLTSGNTWSSQLQLGTDATLTSSGEMGTFYYTYQNNMLRLCGNAKEISNIKFVSESTGAKPCGIVVGGSYTLDKISNVTIEGSTLKAGIEIGGTVNTIENVTVENASEKALYINGGSCNSISNSSFDGAVGVLFANTGSVTFNGVTVTGDTAAVQIACKNASLTVADDENATKATSFSSETGIVVVTNSGASAATFAVDGYTIVDGKVVCANNAHNFVAGTPVAATCTTDGYTPYTCKGCGATENRNVVPATGHTYTTEVTAPTCTADGYTTYTCACGYTYTDNTVPATGHTYTTTVTPATCTEDGVKVYTCACGYTYSETIPATDHNYVAQNGVFVCTNGCGSTIDCVHNWVIVEGGTAATCTEAGTANYECSECDATKTEAIPATGHRYGEGVVTAPTCTADGYTTYTCSACNDSYTDTPTAATGHNYYWNKKTKDENGKVISITQEYGCSACGKNDFVKLVGTWNELKDAVSNAKAGDVIRLNDDITMPWNKNTDTITALSIEKYITFDLGGFTVTSNDTNKWAIFAFKGVKAFGNGNIIHAGESSQALKVYRIDEISDLTIKVTAEAASVGGITLYNYNNGYSHLGLLENVTIYANNNGIETYSAYNNEGKDVIGAMKYVVVETEGQAMTLNTTCGPITNCTFKGDNIAIQFKNLVGKFELLGNCVIEGDVAAIQVDAAEEGSSFVSSDATKFTTNGILFNATQKAKDNGELGVIETTIAAVNGKLYQSLAAAVAALNDSKEEVTTFALMGDLVVTEAIVIDKKVNFSLGGGTYNYIKDGNVVSSITVNGYTITCPNDTNGDGIFRVVEGGVLTLSGKGTVNSVGNNEYSIAIWADGGKVIINEGTYTNVGAGDDDHYDLIYVKNGGSVEINGGTFIAQTPKWTLNINDSNGGTIVVNAGKFYGYNPAESGTEPGGVCSFAADGTCITLVDGYYVVAKAHTYDAVVTAPTCTADGYTTYTCSVCKKDSYTDNTVPATGHTAGEEVVENNVAPDCDTAGSYDKVVYCTVCNAEISRTPVTVDALGHKYVAGEPAADGSVTYTCENGCGSAYVVNNSKISGTYYIESMDMFNATFNNGTLTIVDNVMGMSGTYAYEYVVGTYTVTVEGQSFSFALDRGGNVAALSLASGRQFGLAKYVPAVDAVLGTNTTIAGDIKFVFTAAEDGKYTITANGMMIIIESMGVADVYYDSFEANLVAGVPFEFYISSNAEAQFEIALVPAHVCSFVETSRTESTCTTKGSVTYTCSCGKFYTEELKALGHTEVKVAVVPAYKVDGVYYAGTTSGTKCTVCDYTTVVAIDETFQFKAVSLNLSADINAVYKAQVPSGYEDVYVVFEMNGKTVDVTEYTVETGTKRFCFKYLGIKAAYLADNVSATIYATVDGKIAAYSFPTYSVKAYCASRIATLAKSNTASANNERTMLSDLLVLGEKVQIDGNYKLDNLATSGVEHLTPSAYNGVPSTDNIYSATGTKDARVDWKSAALRVGNDLAIRFKVYIAPEHIEHVTFKVVIDRSDLGLENVVYDYNVVEDNLEYIPSEDRYVVSVDKLKASEYGCKVIGTIYYDGVQVGRTLNYSVNSYAYTKLNGASATLTTEQEMIKAIYNYGKSARKYVGIK